MPSNLLTLAERSYLGLDRNYLELCSDLSISEVSLLHLKCAMLISYKEEEERSKIDSKVYEEASIAKFVKDEMVRYSNNYNNKNHDDIDNNDINNNNNNNSYNHNDIYDNNCDNDNIYNINNNYDS